ncbi:MAG: hypothetical protein QME52_12430 [Bacteroidota bacterium]|nr:hypothetical protein [Bacteroidota bacterium]
MIRYLLWILIIYFAWRIIKTIITIKKRSKSENSSIPPFANIEEAYFEDVTNKPETDNTQPSEKIKETPPSEETS